MYRSRKMNNYEWSIENTLGSIGISVNKNCSGLFYYTVNYSVTVGNVGILEYTNYLHYELFRNRSGEAKPKK